MFLKFLKHLGEGIVDNIANHFKTGFIMIIIACVIALVLLPIACLIGTAPKWILWLELTALVIFIFVQKYKKFKKENS